MTGKQPAVGSELSWEKIILVDAAFGGGFLSLFVAMPAPSEKARGGSI